MSWGKAFNLGEDARAVAYISQKQVRKPSFPSSGQQLGPLDRNKYSSKSSACQSKISILDLISLRSSLPRS